MTENNIDFGKTEFTVKKLNVHYLPIKKLSTISLFFKDMTKKGLYLDIFLEISEIIWNSYMLTTTFVKIYQFFC